MKRHQIVAPRGHRSLPTGSLTLSSKSGLPFYVTLVKGTEGEGESSVTPENTRVQKHKLSEKRYLKVWGVVERGVGGVSMVIKWLPTRLIGHQPTSIRGE